MGVLWVGLEGFLGGGMPRCGFLGLGRLFCWACVVFVGLTFAGVWCIVFLSSTVRLSGKGSGWNYDTDSFYIGTLEVI